MRFGRMDEERGKWEERAGGCHYEVNNAAVTVDW